MIGVIAPFFKALSELSLSSRLLHGKRRLKANRGAILFSVCIAASFTTIATCSIRYSGNGFKSFSYA